MAHWGVGLKDNEWGEGPLPPRPVSGPPILTRPSPLPDHVAETLAMLEITRAFNRGEISADQACVLSGRVGLDRDTAEGMFASIGGWRNYG